MAPASSSTRPNVERVPITWKNAKRYLAAHHRHNAVPSGGWLFGTSIVVDGELVGVGVAGRPARGLQDGRTIEITRVCTTGYINACSTLYGALCRAAQALGYRRAVSYTLDTEDGASLKASGFRLDAHLPAREAHVRPNHGRYQHDLFGNERRPPAPKNRWVRDL